MDNLKTKAKDTAEKNVAADKEALKKPELVSYCIVSTGFERYISCFHNYFWLNLLTGIGIGCWAYCNLCSFGNIRFFNIVPKATSIKGKVTAKSKGFIVKWAKGAKSSVTGYEVQYSTDKKFKLCGHLSVQTGMHSNCHLYNFLWLFPVRAESDCLILLYLRLQELCLLPAP